MFIIIPFEKSVYYHTTNDKNESAFNERTVNIFFSFMEITLHRVFKLFAHGIWHRYAGNKNEQRENHIVKRKSIPGGMMQLIGHPTKERDIGSLS